MNRLGLPRGAMLLCRGAAGKEVPEAKGLQTESC